MKRKIIPKNKIYVGLILAMALTAIAFMCILIIADLFPAQITVTLLCVLGFIFVLSWIMFCKPKKILQYAGMTLSIICIAIYGMGTYYIGSTYATIKKISSAYEANHQNTADKFDATKDSFNIYLTGIDQWESEKGYDLERSDVNMIVTVCPTTRKILLTSIPRDTYITLPRTGENDKLTHTGIYGVDETLKAIDNFLGINMDCYFKSNFTAVVDIIDAIGGIRVYSDREFVPVTRSWWKVQKGWNDMSGTEALAFARERKAYNDKDSVRVENQQKVVKACIKKMTSSPALLTGYGDILKAASKNMSTDIPSDVFQDLIKMQLSEGGSWNISTQKVVGDYEMDYVASLSKDSKYLVYKPREKSVEEVVSNIKNTMNPSKEEVAKAIAGRNKNTLLNFLKVSGNE